MTGGAARQDWKHYKSPAPSQTQDGDDLANAGLPLLQMSEEYVFKIEKVILKERVESPFKPGELQDKFYTTWKEEKTGNLVMVGFRVDRLKYNYKNPKYQSPVLTFFEKLGMPIPEGKEPNWSNLFIEGMRIRSRVTVRKDKDGKPTGKYDMDMPTVRRYLA